jgi:hypothetical protein
MAVKKYRRLVLDFWPKYSLSFLFAHPYGLVLIEESKVLSVKQTT